MFDSVYSTLSSLPWYKKRIGYDARQNYWACLTANCVGSAGWERKPRVTFYVIARLWLHSDLRNWAAFCWSQRNLSA